MLVLVFFLLLVLLRLLIFDTRLLLHGFQSKGISHKCLIRRLFLLFDSEEGILSNLRSGISSVVGILDSNEVLVGGTELNTEVI